MNLVSTRITAFVICSALSALVATPTHARLENMPQVGRGYDLVIRGGRVMDPESGVDAVRNVGIADGIIASVTAEPLVGRTVIDATGLVVAPGFIDADSFQENAPLQVRDGVTTVFNIRDGTSEVARWYAERDARVLINSGVGIGYTRIRADVMGETLRARGAGKRKRPSETQIFEILRGVERGFHEGAVALGMGISGEADPTGWEHVEAYRIAAEARAHVVAILREEDWSPDNNISGYLAQMIGAVSLAGTAVHIPHLISSAGPHTPRVLQMLTRARARGLEFTAEAAPYLASMIRIHPGEMERWSDLEIHEIQPLDSDRRLTRETAADYRDREFLAFAHNDLVNPRLEAVLADAITSPLVSIASHGSDPALFAGFRGLPATSGTFSRVLGRYVRERRIMSLMEALRKMTLMPAQRFEARVPDMRKKGRIRAGADADVVVFDADSVIDRATFNEQLPSDGIRHVLVNGVPVVRDGALQEGVFPGRPIRAPLRARSAGSISTRFLAR